MALVLSATTVSCLLATAAQQPLQTVGPADPKLIEDLIAANRILAQEGIVDGFGHVSVRHNRDKTRFLMARAIAPSLVTPGDLVEYDLDGDGVNVNGRSQYAERYIHAEIYRARPDVNAVVHDHSPSVVPFTVSKTPLRPVYHMAAFMGAGLPLFDIRTAMGMTDMLVSDRARGQALVRVLGDRPAVLMRGHGVAVVGPTLPIVIGRSVYLDMNARIQSQALALGTEVNYLDPEESRKLLEAGEHRGYDRAWDAWKRRAMGALP
jgi:HCOMODA/2-hydroxy-3-carboxy-muconic semialdehyde decarboxylase